MYNEVIFIILLRKSSTPLKIENNKEKIILPEDGFEIKSYSLYMKNSEAYTSLYEANGRDNLDDIFVDLDYLMIYSESNE